MRKKSDQRAGISRRAFVAVGGAAIAGVGIQGLLSRAQAEQQVQSGFQLRGYYITFMRMPTFGLAAWKQAIDCFAADEINTLILWMAGGFRSKKFPITWKYNQEHENVRADFGRDLIRYAQSKGIRVLLGFTPFGYDGVNQFSIEHPQLKALQKDGNPTDAFGIHCWGWNLCASKPQSQRFMLEYAREMYFDFYPEADGLLIESSDYAICHCAECSGHFYEREFDFIAALSKEIWEKRRDATIVVYPHYFSGSKVPGMDADGARMAFDARWTLFFTPHSAHVDSKLVKQAKSTIWSDDAPALHDPETIRARAHRATEDRLTGYVPSLEAFSYVATHPEEGREDLVGKRQIPFGFGWLKAGEMPYNELPIRVNRVAFREFSKEPQLSIEEFKKRLGLEVFGANETLPGLVDDLLLLQRAFFNGRTWCQPSPLASPERVRVELMAGRVKASQLVAYRSALQELEATTARHADSSNAARREMHRIGKWVLDQWRGTNMDLLNSAKG